MLRTGAGLTLICLALLPAVADEPAWVAKVPDYRSFWPSPPETGSAASDFTLKDLVSGRSVRLSKAREDAKATLLLFVDSHCGTCKRRKADLAATLTRVSGIEGAAAITVFVKSLASRGREDAKEFAEDAGFPEGPRLWDDDHGTAKVALEYRILVSPTAVVLDAEGKIAYFGLALDGSGADLLPGIVSRIANGKTLNGPAARPPFG